MAAGWTFADPAPEVYSARFWFLLRFENIVRKRPCQNVRKDMMASNLISKL